MPSLSVLDQSPISRGGTPSTALQETLDLARAADHLGYARYWVAEHHNTPFLASSVPEIMIGQIAAHTERIRVGSGGVMLPHYSPLKVAEAFKLLEALFPGRIDLGVGRAPGSDARTARAMAYAEARMDLDRFPDQALDLWAFLTDGFPEGHEYHGIQASPTGDHMPELWMLGSSSAGAGYAAEFGWSYCHADFINPISTARAIEAYRTMFQPSPFLAGPHPMLAVFVLAAETHAEAERLMWPRWAWKVLGRRGSFPTPEEAMAYDYKPHERDYIEHQRTTDIYGTGEEVRDRLLAMGEDLDVDDFMLLTITGEHASRLRSYELVADALGLQAAIA